jgi:hypothetical protein
MALETNYVVENNTEDGFPVIYRCILVDGVEVSRGEATFIEVKNAYPSIIQEYFNAAAVWAHSFADYLDGQADFTALNFVEMTKASRFFYDFMHKFDYAAIASSPDLPHLTPPPVVEETPVVE